MPQIELLHTDCIEYMAGLPDKAFDLAIVDPPYGIGISDFKRKNTKTAKFDGTKAWDNNRPSPEYFKELFRVSCGQVVWGMNHLHDMLPTTRGFVSWFKHQNGHFSECELAWTSGNRGRYFDLPYQADLYGKIHPTQKPVALYRWLLRTTPSPASGYSTRTWAAGPSRSPATWKASTLWAVKLTRTTSRPLGIG